MNAASKNRRLQEGFNLIEVLVTLIILMLGLLGLAGLMMQSQRAETESYQRVQALILVQDMVGRINANRKAAACYITTNLEPAYLGTDIESDATPEACATGSAEQQARAIQDMQDWNDMLNGSAEVSGENNVGAMVGARGCVSFDASTNQYLVSVAWQGLGSSAEPPEAWDCASGLYGGDDETKRRVVGIVFQLAAMG